MALRFGWPFRRRTAVARTAETAASSASSVGPAAQPDTPVPAAPGAAFEPAGTRPIALDPQFATSLERRVQGFAGTRVLPPDGGYSTMAFLPRSVQRLPESTRTSFTPTLSFEGWEPAGNEFLRTLPSLMSFDDPSSLISDRRASVSDLGAAPLATDVFAGFGTSVAAETGRPAATRRQRAAPAVAARFVARRPDPARPPLPQREGVFVAPPPPAARSVALRPPEALRTAPDSGGRPGNDVEGSGNDPVVTGPAAPTAPAALQRLAVPPPPQGSAGPAAPAGTGATSAAAAPAGTRATSAAAAPAVDAAESAGQGLPTAASGSEAVAGTSAYEAVRPEPAPVAPPLDLALAGPATVAQAGTDPVRASAAPMSPPDVTPARTASAAPSEVARQADQGPSAPTQRAPAAPPLPATVALPSGAPAASGPTPAAASERSPAAAGTAGASPAAQASPTLARPSDRPATASPAEAPRSGFRILRSAERVLDLVLRPFGGGRQPDSADDGPLRPSNSPTQAPDGRAAPLRRSAEARPAAPSPPPRPASTTTTPAPSAMPLANAPSAVPSGTAARSAATMSATTASRSIPTDPVTGTPAAEVSAAPAALPGSGALVAPALAAATPTRPATSAGDAPEAGLVFRTLDLGEAFEQGGPAAAVPAASAASPEQPGASSPSATGLATPSRSPLATFAQSSVASTSGGATGTAGATSPVGRLARVFARTPSLTPIPATGGGGSTGATGNSAGRRSPFRALSRWPEQPSNVPQATMAPGPDGAATLQLPPGWQLGSAPAYQAPPVGPMGSAVPMPGGGGPSTLLGPAPGVGGSGAAPGTMQQANAAMEPQVLPLAPVAQMGAPDPEAVEMGPLPPTPGAHGTLAPAEGAAAQGGNAAGGTDAGPSIEVDKLADQIWQVIRRKLAIERERQRGR